MTQTANITEDRPAALTRRQSRTECGGPDGEAAFAALFSTLRAGYADGVLAVRSGASTQGAFSSALRGDARTCRIEHMTTAAREEARRSAGRHAGLSDAPETRELGGRAQRLGVEKEAAADPRSGRMGKSATTHCGTAGAKVTGTQQNDVKGLHPQGEERGNAPRAHRGAVLADGVSTKEVGARSPAEATPAQGCGVKNMTSVETRGEAFPTSPAASAREVPAPRAVPAAKPPPTVARQIGQLLSAKLEGPNVTRALDGSVGVRSEARSARPTASSIVSNKAAPTRSPGQSDVTRTVFDKLVRNLRMNLGTKQSTARIRLHPPELGHVRVDVKMVDLRIDVRVQAENPAARELIGERLEVLRSALRDHGLIAERVELVEPRPEQQTFVTPDGGRHQDDPHETPVSEWRADERGDEPDADDQQGSYPRAEQDEEDDETLVTVLDARLDIHI